MEFARHLKMRNVSLGCTAMKFTRDEFPGCTSYSVTSPAGEWRVCLMVQPVSTWIRKLGNPKPGAPLPGPASLGRTVQVDGARGYPSPDGGGDLSDKLGPTRRAEAQRLKLVHIAVTPWTVMLPGFTQHNPCDCWVVTGAVFEAFSGRFRGVFGAFSRRFRGVFEGFSRRF